MVATDSLRACFELLPRSARVEYVGYMKGRPEATIRVCVSGIAVDAASFYLKTITGVDEHWAAAVARTAAVNHGTDGISRIGILHIDIDGHGGVLQRIGLERTFARACQRHGAVAADDKAFMGRVALSGLCCSTKHEALSAWPGRSLAILPHELWWSVIERRINHIKFVSSPSGSLEAKAYLFATFRAQDTKRPIGMTKHGMCTNRR